MTPSVHTDSPSPGDIEIYFHTGPGYNPFLCRPGWQVAQLNFVPTYLARNIRLVERHAATDEAFVLVQGAAILVAAGETPSGLGFRVQPMQVGVTYNIPCGVWHTIAMQPGDLVIVVEKSGTHTNDVVCRDLTPVEYLALQQALVSPAPHPPSRACPLRPPRTTPSSNCTTQP